ncbi:hypothetical protein DICPUDRAFT_85687 [Dictyostelium purpureum]|uniref:RRM domain-containing protein n=1 Tax=Dictyostelium purpureum TaxID=5786 RepID=F0Z6G0_DICPU|nr:uncharacterized protein DICPUDRAFT_85687 [Dictyostelium purpureum]EGC40483.1 hypothetical protein DICPUDRAFT_85687 [Dictyostelium purpureum]|eukprot:XP_003283030.1 hypothetical protein DICPUDRAFT_85687 [Dictyostelium purpureum]
MTDIKKREFENVDSLSNYNEADSSKRLKTESDEIDRSIEPSPVVHCRGLPITITESDLHSLLSPFGKIQAVCMLRMGQALIEMDSVQSSSNIINRSITKPFLLNNQKILFSYSKSQHLNNVKKNQPMVPGGSNQNIILCTILNPFYPITTNTLHTIMSPYGRVLRIVIFQKKSGLQAFVEFDSPYSANTAKETLNGYNIYTECCKLQIEFARVSKLNVKQNDEKTADYTTPDFYSQQLIQSPQGMQMYHHAAGSNPFGASHGAGFINGGGPQQYGGAPYMYPAVGNPESVNQPVISVSKIPEDIDTDKLFNLFCLYGNVIKIKMLHNSKGSAMVQMGDSIQAEIAVQCLNHSFIYGQKINCYHTKHPFIVDSEKTKDYSKSTLNRFLNSQPYGKNAYKPSSTLHFLNVPLHYSEKQLSDVFAKNGTHYPIHVKFFPTKPESTKHLGLLEFQDTRSATEALMDLNNYKVEGNPLKLSFTMNTIHKTDAK